MTTDTVYIEYDFSKNPREMNDQKVKSDFD